MSNNSQRSFPFLSILCLILITLKLTGFIAWSWWWVLAPVWIPMLLLATLLIILGTMWLAAYRKMK